MEDDLALIRAAGLTLSDEEALQVVMLRRNYAEARSALDSVHLGETEPVVTFRALASPPEPEMSEEGT